MAEVALTVNERPLNFLIEPVKTRWFYLETDHFASLAGINRITIKPPMFIPVQELTPGSRDGRRLGIALADMEVGP